MQKIIWLLGLVIAVAIGIASAAWMSSSSNKIIQENGSIEVCFTRETGCRLRVYGILGNATQIKAALYDLDDKTIVKILEDKNAQVVIDSDNFFGLGAEIDNEAGLMHNKFFLIKHSDGSRILIAGSANPTRNDMEKNYNNILIISSPTLYVNFEDEFEELVTFKKTKTKHTVQVGQTIIENYFCPEDNCEMQVLSEISNANHSIYFMTFSFTSDEIGNALMESDVDIKGIFDTSQVNSQKAYTEYFRMLERGLDVHLDNSSTKLHHKVFIIDGQTVITGSYNPTQAGATRNDENLLIIHDPTIASKFTEEFKLLYPANFI